MIYLYFKEASALLGINSTVVLEVHIYAIEKPIVCLDIRPSSCNI